MSDKKNALRDYVEVNVRIEKFYETFPEGRILTQLLKWEDGIVVMRAEVYRNSEDDRPAATGHAYEKEGSNFINETSALENCETSAVGRALALLGFEVKKSIASREEVANAKAQQKQSGNGQVQGKPATQKQINAIMYEADRANVSEEALKKAMMREFGKQSRKDLTTREASKLIKMLQERGGGADAQAG
jgi:hypothetical protein